MTRQPGKVTSSDADLIRRFTKTGDRTALDQLILRHLGKIRNLVFRMVLSESVADDLTQDVILKAVRGLANFDGKSQFRSWIYRIALNTTYTYIERRSRSPVQYSAEPPHPAARGACGPEQVAMHIELKQQVDDALNELSPKLRAAIVLTTLEQIEPREAAKIEGCSTSTMYWRIHEARKQLKQRLREHLSP